MRQVIKIVLQGFIISLPAVAAIAQQKPGKTIDVTSTFKPSLRPAAKLNLQAAPAPVDTSRLVAPYKVPNQNLTFAYEPGGLRPLAHQPDSGGTWEASNYLKLGFGNYTTPLGELGLTLGNGPSQLTLMADYISSKGKREWQDFSQANFKLNGQHRIKQHLELSGGFHMRFDGFHTYGYQPDTLVFPKDSVLQRFNSVGAQVGFRNLAPTNFGLYYFPQISIESFTDNREATEWNTKLLLPMRKSFGKAFGLDIDVLADYTKYNRPDSGERTNNIYSVAPSITFTTPRVEANIGVTPAWDNEVFNLLPNISAEFTGNNLRFTILAGYVGQLQKNTYSSLSKFNPWLEQPTTLRNTRLHELYGGVKGSLGNHFVYDVKLGWQSYSNLVLWVNDERDGRRFTQRYEAKVNALKLSAEAGYQLQEKLSAKLGIQLYDFTNQETEKGVYGFLPSQLNASLRWQFRPDFAVTSTLSGWQGADYLTKTGLVDQQKGAIDWNIGAEFTATEKISLWLNFNNVFNNQYQRWNQYPVYGFQVIGGILVSFAKTK